MGQTAANGMRGVGPSDNKLPWKIVLWLVVLWRVDATHTPPPPTPPHLGAHCPLSHLLARDGLCVTYELLTTLVSVTMCLMIHVLKCSIEAAGAADSSGCDQGLWVGCGVSGRRTANYHGKLFCGWLFSGGWILRPPPSTRCLLFFVAPVGSGWLVCRIKF